MSGANWNPARLDLLQELHSQRKSYREIADQLGISREAVAGKLHHLRNKQKQQMAPIAKTPLWQQALDLANKGKSEAAIADALKRTPKQVAYLLDYAARRQVTGLVVPMRLPYEAHAIITAAAKARRMPTNVLCSRLLSALASDLPDEIIDDLLADTKP